MPVTTSAALLALIGVFDMVGTIALCRAHFGSARSGVVFGWVFAFHMVGAGIAAAYAGWVRQTQGDYLTAWVTAGVLCLVAAVAILLVPRSPTGKLVPLSPLGDPRPGTWRHVPPSGDLRPANWSRTARA